ncbi:Histone-lysine N-methyltransferase SETMAR [Eufriesea mexicana]|uniref:Histone-lysine N-methyltransferase SETMAR n=1 Tax=Eufriesea mexicana TaxID=516756 RepID=A0A310SID0_9HYME|nr:Histone-lysine N-methyltransferase SETMAR [Eufriesea mexicana]
MGISRLVRLICSKEFVSGDRLVVTQHFLFFLPAQADRRGTVFLHDNARSHTSILTRQKLQELGWEVLMHPPYSPDLVPSGYHLFLSMANNFAGEKFASREACENRLSQFFANRDKDFYERGIMELPSKWQQVIEQNEGSSAEEHLGQT